MLDHNTIVANLQTVHNWCKLTCEWASMYYRGSCNYSMLVWVLGSKRAKMVANAR